MSNGGSTKGDGVTEVPKSGVKPSLVLENFRDPLSLLYVIVNSEEMETGTNRNLCHEEVMDRERETETGKRYTQWQYNRGDQEQGLCVL